MEKFAVIALPENVEKLIDAHPVLKHMPGRYGQLLLQYIPAQVMGIIMDTEENTELGYMLAVPGFFMDWDKQEQGERLNHIDKLIRKMQQLDIYVLCFPLVYRYFNQYEMDYLYDKGVTILDGFHHRMAGLLLTLKQLLFIVRKDLPYYDVGIWGADTEHGKVWVEFLASQVNAMTIGGNNAKILNILSDRILKATGLACQVTTNAEVCFSNKHITVAAEHVEINFRRKEPSFHFPAYREVGGEAKHKGLDSGIYTLEMGWMVLPSDLGIDQDISVWEELGVIDGLFFIISKVYREDILPGRITLRQMERLHALYGLYPLKVQGFIQNNRKIHFDRLRMEYFRGKRRVLHTEESSDKSLQ